MINYDIVKDMHVVVVATLAMIVPFAWQPDIA